MGLCDVRIVDKCTVVALHIGSLEVYVVPPLLIAYNMVDVPVFLPLSHGFILLTELRVVSCREEMIRKVKFIQNDEPRGKSGLVALGFVPWSRS